MAARIAVLFALVAALCGLSSAANYCNVRTCDRGAHTACMFRSTLPARQCSGVKQTGLTADEKKRVLKLHNVLRRKVARGQERDGRPGPQPAATNMANLVWDDELANIAQTWASQCKYGHDSCRDVDRFKVGQNIAFRGTTGDVMSIKVEELVNMWYNEVKDYNRNKVAKFENLSSSNGKPIGHYTQMVWAETTKLGCGAMRYKDGRFNRFYLVCNYGPAGNFYEKPVYRTRH